MKMSQLFSTTLREAPNDAEVVSHKLLLRAGFIRPLMAGSYSLLPLGWRVKQKVEQIIREEMDAIGSQEMLMPVVQPAEIWQATGRWDAVGPEMLRLKDRAGRDLTVAITSEEVVADLLRREIKSYKQLPQVVYHFQTKFRDEPRPRAGLIRTREFIMKDAYSAHADMADLDRLYNDMYKAYQNVFKRVNIPIVAVHSDVGMMGGNEAHEFMFLNPIGEDSIVFAPKSGYTANRQVARIQKPQPQQEAVQELEEVATPDTTTIEALAKLLGIEASRTGKAVFFYSPDLAKVIFAVVRGDMEVNETKVSNLAKARELRPATAEEITAIGAVPGYASPIEVDNAIVIVDDLVTQSPNLVMGANRAGYHLKNVNYDRDYKADIVGDIVAAQIGDLEPGGSGEALQIERGVELGNIFKLGTKYSLGLGATFLDKDGTEKPIIMGSYGIGVGRLMAAAVEAYNDNNGIMWPWSIAPYQVHLVQIQTDQGAHLYHDLVGAGVEVLFDDREISPGVKFKDADLIGVPLRLTISAKSLEKGGVEWKYRNPNDGPEAIVPLNEIVAKVRESIYNHIA